VRASSRGLEGGASVRENSYGLHDAYLLFICLSECSTKDAELLEELKAYKSDTLDAVNPGGCTCARDTWLSKCSHSGSITAMVRSSSMGGTPLHSKESMLLFRGHLSVHGLFDYLLNSLRGSIGEGEF
jgi:hypothetical protein